MKKRAVGIIVIVAICLAIAGGGLYVELGNEGKEGVVSYFDDGKYIGQTKTVEGRIVDTFSYNNEVIFLNFHKPHERYFTAVIWSNDWDKFPFAPEVYYKGKKVRVTGRIQEYERSPEIIVSDPSQIKEV